MSTPSGSDRPRRARPAGSGGRGSGSRDAAAPRSSSSGSGSGTRDGAGGRGASGARGGTTPAGPRSAGAGGGRGGATGSGRPATGATRPTTGAGASSGPPRTERSEPRTERPRGTDRAEARTDRSSGTGSSGAPGAPRAGATREEIERREYDPRREARRQLARVPLPDDADARELDRQTRSQLLTLAKDTADLVARHLVMAGRLLDEDPQEALRHARAARALGGRVAAAREANGIAAYLAGEWTEALSELRTARRMSGDPEHLPVMADCERALGRPDRALLMTQDPQSKDLSPEGQVELLIVGSGARRDLGQTDAAVALLEVAALHGPTRPWTARLRYAYADALLAAGREEQAREWFARTLQADPDSTTDADERLLELDGIVLEDHDPNADDDPDATGDGAEDPGRPLA